MNYRQQRELEQREQRRELILNGECPHCTGALYANKAMNERSPRFHWFTCERCRTTMGIQKR